MKQVFDCVVHQPARRAFLLGTAGGGLLSIAGCVSVGVGNDAGMQPMYVLHDPTATASVSASAQTAALPRVPTLLIQSLPADAVAETVSIAYSRRPQELAFYQLASWSERPVRRIPQLLRARLQAQGVAAAVGLVGEPLQSPWLLSVGIDALVHDVSSPPGRAQVAFTLALYDRPSMQRLGSRRFDASAAVSVADSAHAVAAMSVALGRAFDAAVPWIESLLPAAPSR